MQVDGNEWIWWEVLLEARYAEVSDVFGSGDVISRDPSRHGGYFRGKGGRQVLVLRGKQGAVRREKGFDTSWPDGLPIHDLVWHAIDRGEGADPPGISSGIADYGHIGCVGLLKGAPGEGFTTANS